MGTRMLIDATHPEETRVVVVQGKRLEEFDFESSTKRQLKGNIYLAKVARVEPSLQAAFVEYGGNRHGFLTFNEIHPDYYQIPISDREALLADEAAQRAAERAEDDAEAAAADQGAARGSASDEAERDPEEAAAISEPEAGESDLEAIGGDELDEVALRRSARPNRNYRVQEVIKRRQIMLVQVVKEERGTKGAALTTYLSFAGRYCVLMPNTARGGGISRKIVNPADRKRLKGITNDLELPEGMGLIVRTAGADRSKAEIKRDSEYLIRVWDLVRELTLKSTAPSPIYEEANLIKRAIRDLYTKDMDEILVEGDEGYKTAKAFMRMLMPSHAKRVQPYRNGVPLFHRYDVEPQFDSMHKPEVHLKGGGYVVIDSTEALVAIDVNSGRSTKERNIEETALKTNLEAADEIARQVRLRDLAGLIVIDFIDMVEHKNNRSVERRMKEALKVDRARIQVGHISAFGLLEMSRQRLRPSLLEASTEACAHCSGTGYVRSIESTSLHVLRSIEREGMHQGGAHITVHVATSVAIYLLNQKRDAIEDIERRYEFKIFVVANDELVPPDHRIERTKMHTVGETAQRREDAGTDKPIALIAKPAEEAPQGAETAVEDGSEADAEAAQGKRRRRGKRGGRRRGHRAQPEEQTTAVATTEEAGGDEPRVELVDRPERSEGDAQSSETAAPERTEAAADGTRARSDRTRRRRTRGPKRPVEPATGDAETPSRAVTSADQLSEPTERAERAEPAEPAEPKVATDIVVPDSGTDRSPPPEILDSPGIGILTAQPRDAGPAAFAGHDGTPAAVPEAAPAREAEDAGAPTIISLSDYAGEPEAPLAETQPPEIHARHDSDVGVPAHSDAAKDEPEANKPALRRGWWRRFGDE